MVYLATDAARGIFSRLEKHGVAADEVKFEHNGSSVQVQIKADDSKLLKIAKDIQPLVPDIEGSRVSFIVVNQDGAGVIVYRKKLFDTRPLLDVMMKKIEAEESVTSEQGVAPQSATRSKSAAKVGAESKTESEVRSQ